MKVAALLRRTDLRDTDTISFPSLFGGMGHIETSSGF
jgi:hypothetical protein